MLVKAYRFRKGPDFYNLAAPVLKTITRDEESQRVRKIKPDEAIASLYDKIHDGRTKFHFGDGTRTDAEPPKGVFYNEADALEDQVLFPEELDAKQSKPLVFREPAHRLHKFEHGGPDMHKFVTGYSTSESDYTDVDENDDANGLEGHAGFGSDTDSFVSTDESLSTEGSGNREADDSDIDGIVSQGHKKQDDPYDVEQDFWYWIDKEKAKCYI